MNRWSVTVGIITHLVLASACASKVNSTGGGSETGFLTCSVDSECGTGHCVEAKCVDDSRNTLATSEVHAGTCDDPGGFTQSVPAWWQAEWTQSLPLLASQTCGDNNNPQFAPAIVGKWTAPSAGTYWAEGYSRDMSAVFGATKACGVPDGCSVIEPQEVPDPPFDPSRVNGFTFEAKAGEAWFFTFQYLKWLDAGPPPDRGTVIVGIKPWSP